MRRPKEPFTSPKLMRRLPDVRAEVCWKIRLLTKNSSILKTAFMCWQNLEKLRRRGTSMRDFGSCAPAAKCVGSRCMGFQYGTLRAKCTGWSERVRITLGGRNRED